MMTTAHKWSTSSYGETTETTPMELAALGEHLTQCSVASGHMVAMQCGAQKLRGFMTARLMTTLAVVAALIGAVLLIW